MGKNKLDRQLYDAVKKNNVRLVGQLLMKGADPEAKVGKKGMTALDRAEQGQQRDVQAILQAKGGKLHGDLQGDEGSAGTMIRHSSSSSSSAATSSATPSTPNAVTPTDTATTKRRKKVSADLAAELQTQRQASPEKVPMSRLAMGVRESVRRRKASSDSAVSAAAAGRQASAASIKSAASAKSQGSAGGDWTRPPEEEEELPEVDQTKDWEVDRKYVKQVKKLGQGNFGLVFEAVVKNLSPSQPGETRVAVKMLNSDSDEVKEDFFKEVQIMKAITKPRNIVRLLGVCTKAEPYLMVMELMAKGDLKTVLRGNRPKKGKPSILSMKRIIELGADVADGMAYLTEIKIVHRDLAARNCLVNDEWRCKVGDFGLTRDVYQGEYYRMTGSAPLPIRWMAPESIMDGVYSSSSDVWSFGIVLWELATFAKMPYVGMSNMEVCEQVTEEDFRLAQPKGCSNELYQIILSCWKETASERATFSELEAALLKLAGTSDPNPIGKDSKNGAAGFGRNMTQLDVVIPAAETATTDEDLYEAPQDSKASAYIPDSERDDKANEVQYSDARLTGLSSIDLAVTMANEQNDIKDVKMEKARRSFEIVNKTVEEETLDGTLAKGSPLRNTSAGRAPRPSQPSSTPERKSLTSRYLENVKDTNTPTTAKNKEYDHISSMLRSERDKLEASPVTVADKALKKGKEASPDVSRINAAHKLLPASTASADFALTNDSSQTAEKARLQKTLIAEKAEADLTKWVEAVIGDYLPDTFVASLRSGEVLCMLINKISPGIIAKYHTGPRMAFKQMENIGKFLDACRTYGVNDKDLFVTVDLFEQRNVRGVISCLDNLKIVSETKGFRV